MIMQNGHVAASLACLIGPTDCGACFDDDRRYRYTLWRRWVSGCVESDMVAFIGLNPSTADESTNDPTVRRCIDFAKRWKFGGMVMLNIFAFRATDPDVMKAASEPIGNHNSFVLRHVTTRVGKSIVCWGTHGAFNGRGPSVERMLLNSDWFKQHGRTLYHLGLTKYGFPRHPLYVAGSTELTPLAAAMPVCGSRN